jgi:hypothetical protein
MDVDVLIPATRSCAPAATVKVVSVMATWAGVPVLTVRSPVIVASARR